MAQYLILFAIVFGVNLLPAFGPPTWSIIVVYGLNSPMPITALVIIGAVAAALGRLVLAQGFRHLRRYVPAKTKTNLAAAGQALAQRKHHSFLALGLFALSPLPSAQLFEAAGLIGVGLAKFTAAFFAGRIVSYSIYAATAKRIEASTLGDTFRHALLSPIGIGVQIAMIALLVLLTQLNWQKYLGGAGSGK